MGGGGREGGMKEGGGGGREGGMKEGGGGERGRNEGGWGGGREGGMKEGGGGGRERNKTRGTRGSPLEGIKKTEVRREVIIKER